MYSVPGSCMRPLGYTRYSSYKAKQCNCGLYEFKITENLGRRTVPQRVYIWLHNHKNDPVTNGGAGREKSKGII